MRVLEHTTDRRREITNIKCRSGGERDETLKQTIRLLIIALIAGGNERKSRCGERKRIKKNR